MKVVFLHAAWNGMGPEYRVHATLAKHAPKGSIQPYFIWQGPQFSSGIVPSHQVEFYDFGRDMSKLPKPGRASRAAQIGRKLPGAIGNLARLIRSLKPDLLYTSQQGMDVFLARIMSKWFNVPHAIHIHYNVGPWLGRSTMRAISTSTRLIAVSEFTRQTALLAGVAPENIYTVLNPTPAHDEATVIDRRALREALGYGPDTPLVISVGRLDPGKGHIPLFEAFAEVVKDLPSARLLVCGRSSYRNNYEDALRQKINDPSLRERVVLAGHRNDVRQLMRCSDVFCLPAEMEPCGLVFLEAAAEGLPSVAYRSGGVPEIISHGQTGLLSYPGDTHALAANIMRLLTDHEFARRLGAAAQNVALEKFQPARVAERWVRVLKLASKSK